MSHGLPSHLMSSQSLEYWMPFDLHLMNQLVHFLYIYISFSVNNNELVNISGEMLSQKFTLIMFIPWIKNFVSSSGGVEDGRYNLIIIWLQF